MRVYGGAEPTRPAFESRHYRGADHERLVDVAEGTPSGCCVSPRARCCTRLATCAQAVLRPGPIGLKPPPCATQFAMSTPKQHERTRGKMQQAAVEYAPATLGVDGSGAEARTKARSWLAGDGPPCHSIVVHRLTLTGSIMQTGIRN